MKRRFPIILIIILCIALLCGCGRINADPGAIDPHYGMTEVYNGATSIWIYPEDGVPVNPVGPDDIISDPDGNRVYCGRDYSSAVRGVDVSSHQRDIDWQQVADSGIRFAILRVGGRYYTGDGELYDDDLFEQNFEGAKAAGLKVGLYFFSQAVSPGEAADEAVMVLERLDNRAIELPVFFDWERIAGDAGRANDLDGDTMTECAIAFCETVRAGGYEAGVYFNLDTSYYGYEMARLTDYTFWCAAPGDYPYCYYAHTLWQYSFEGAVPGIETVCDLDMMFVE